MANNDVTLWFISRDIFRNITTYFKHQRLLKFETFLKQVDLFKDMSRRALFRVAEALEEEEHEAEDKIIIQGDQGNHFYIVEEGEVKFSKINEETGLEADLKVSGGVGKFFGERALIAEEVRSATVTAKTDCVLLSLDREHFQKLMGDLSRVKTKDGRSKADMLREATKVGDKFLEDITLGQLTEMQTWPGRLWRYACSTSRQRNCMPSSISSKRCRIKQSRNT